MAEPLSATDDDTPQQLAARLRADLRHRWALGERPAAETYLESHPELRSDQESLLDLIYQEIVEREARHESPRLEEYLERFPDLAGPLRQQFEVNEAIGSGLDDFPPTIVQRSAADSRPSALPRIPGYELLGVLGRGGMGVVYKARHVQLNRVVALKTILHGVHAGADELARFRSEAAAVARLQHPNIVTLYEAGEEQGHPYFVLEYVEGSSLAERLTGAPLPPEQAAALVRTLADAMHYAHTQGVIHRDLKPANILLQQLATDEQGLKQIKKDEIIGFDSSICLHLCSSVANFVPKISDFGLAKCLESDSGLTQTGAILGTPSYMAPEQARGDNRAVGPATDVYALGAILYELLTGHPPFRAATPMETALQVLHQDAVAPRRLQGQTPRDLETVCLKCLEKDPRRRYPSAAALAEDLRRFLAGEPILARPSSWTQRAAKWARRRPAVAALLAAVVLVASLGLAGVLWQWREAVAGRAAAELAHKQEQDQRRKAEATLYGAHVAQAQRDWSFCNLDYANHLLGECDPALRDWEWRYLKRLCNWELLALSHGEEACGVAYSPDGRRLATCTGTWISKGPGEVKIWHARTGELLAECRGHSGPVMGVAFDPAGRRLAAASLDATVRIYDAQTGKELHCLRGHSGWVHAVAFRPDGRVLASAGSDRMVRLWDPDTGKPLRTLTGHRDNVFTVAFSPDGLWLASGSRDWTVRVWDAATWELAQKLTAPSDVRCVAFSPDGRRVAAGSWDAAVTVFDVHGEREPLTHHLHATPVRGIAFGPDGRMLASCDNEGVIRVVEPRTGREISVVRGHSQSVLAVAFSPDGRALASASYDRTVKVWDATGQQEARTARDPNAWVSNLDFSPDGKRFALSFTGNARAPVKAVRVWDTNAAQAILTLGKLPTAVHAVAFSPDGATLALAGDDGTVLLCDAATGRQSRAVAAHAQAVTDLAWCADGKQLATAGADGAIAVWSAETWQEVRRLDARAGRVARVRFSPDGRRIASAHADRSVRLWDGATGVETAVLRGHSGAVTCLAFAPDGDRLATGGEDQTVKLWSLPGGEELCVLRGHGGAVAAVAFHPDGRRLASVGKDAKIKLWDTAAFRELLMLRGHTTGLTAVAFSPDGRWLVSAGLEIKLWDAQEPTAQARAARLRAVEEGATAWHERGARACEQGRNWTGAVLHLGRLLEGKPAALLHARRGLAFAELGRWKEAEADAARAVDPREIDPRGWLLRVSLRLREGDIDGYRRVCSACREAYGDKPSPGAANDVAWLCCLAPGGADPEVIVRLAERAVADNPSPAHLNTLGAALYRAGRYRDAIVRLHESAKKRASGALVEDWLFLAMAHYRLENAAEARRWLALAAARIDETSDPEAAPAGVAVPLWAIRVGQRALRAEAEALLNAKR